MYSTPDYIGNSSDFICRTYLNNYSSYLPIKYMVHNLVRIFVSATHMSVTCELSVVINCIWVHIYTNSGAIPVQNNDIVN